MQLLTHAFTLKADYQNKVEEGRTWMIKYILYKIV